MLLATRWALIPAILAGWLCLAAPAFAVAPEVKDEAGLFSADALKRANEVIREVDRRFSKDVVIETYKGIPADKEAQFKNMGRESFFAKWAKDRFAALRTDGIYILICDNPKQLEIVLGAKTEQEAFRPADRDRLRKDMVAGLKAGKPDQALLNGVQLVSDTLQTNQKSAAPVRKTTSNQPAPAPAAGGGGGYSWGGLICMGLLIIGGIWLVVGLVRAFTGGWGGYGPGGYYGGGGGFFSSLMGGLFGAAAGMWLYNNFFGGHHSSGFESTAYGSEGGAGGFSSDEGQAGSTTGDSWDSDSGGSSGGDWGGGDSGGDWGGGGGDWGGGGGDFGGGGDW